MAKASNPNQILDNRYQLKGILGKGAMGEVYLAQHVLLGGQFAIKFLSHAFLTKQMRDRFFAEARTCAQLGQRSIHIVRVTDYGVDPDGIPYYVMEYLEGKNLSEVIQTSTIPLSRFINIVLQICLGLQCAHQGLTIEGKTFPIIHRDIKPKNILVSQDDSFGELVKVLDFGIATLLEGERERNKSFMGTLVYSSPEQMEGKPLDGRSDIYSLGVVMYQMLTGRLPVQAEAHNFESWLKAHKTMPPTSIEAVKPGLKLPKAIPHLIMDCLAKSPADRPQSVAEVIEILKPLDERFGAGREIGQRISSALTRKFHELVPASPAQGEGQITPPEPPSNPSLSKPLTLEEVCHQQQWPPGKPIAKIVFPEFIETVEGTLVTLWTMLDQAEIEHVRTHPLYNLFYQNYLAVMSPYPTLLWITALYNAELHRESGPRWFRCFIDLKERRGQEIVRSLGDRGEFRILLFAQESPQRCAHVIKLSINPNQCEMLQRWAIQGQSWSAIGHLQEGKNLLNQEMEKMKPKVRADFEKQSL